MELPKKHLKENCILFSECKRQHYRFIWCDWIHISLIDCETSWDIIKWSIITIYDLKEFAWEFLHLSPCDEKNVYNLVNSDWSINFTS